MKSDPIVIGGKRIGRMRASLLLFTETFRFLWSDKEMLWVPILSGLTQLFLIGILTVTVLIPFGFLGEGGNTQGVQHTQRIEYLYIFVFYVISAFTIAYSQAIVTHIVYTRVRGGDATLWSGIATAGRHWITLFAWACITSTVGIILRVIAERSSILVKIIVLILGSAWSVLTYFVVPAIIIDNKSALSAIGHSGTVFKRTWGETLVTNISFGLVFVLAVLALSVVMVGAVIATGGGVAILFVCIPIILLAILICVVLSAVLDSVLRVLLYVYASEQIIPTNFNKELLESILSRKSVTSEIQTQTTV